MTVEADASTGLGCFSPFLPLGTSFPSVTFSLSTEVLLPLLLVSGDRLVCADPFVLLLPTSLDSVVSEILLGVLLEEVRDGLALLLTPAATDEVAAEVDASFLLEEPVLPERLGVGMCSGPWVEGNGCCEVDSPCLVSVFFVMGPVKGAVLLNGVRVTRLGGT